MLSIGDISVDQIYEHAHKWRASSDLWSVECKGLQGRQNMDKGENHRNSYSIAWKNSLDKTFTESGIEPGNSLLVDNDVIAKPSSRTMSNVSNKISKISNILC